MSGNVRQERVDDRKERGERRKKQGRLSTEERGKEGEKKSRSKIIRIFGNFFSVEPLTMADRGEVNEFNFIEDKSVGRDDWRVADVTIAVLEREKERERSIREERAKGRRKGHRWKIKPKGELLRDEMRNYLWRDNKSRLLSFRKKRNNELDSRYHLS